MTGRIISSHHRTNGFHIREHVVIHLRQQETTSTSELEGCLSLKADAIGTFSAAQDILALLLDLLLLRLQVLDDGIGLVDRGGCGDVVEGGIRCEQRCRGRPQKGLVNVRHYWTVQKSIETKYERVKTRRAGRSAVWCSGSASGSKGTQGKSPLLCQGRSM